jgi:hypothetical protein
MEPAFTALSRDTGLVGPYDPYSYSFHPDGRRLLTKRPPPSQAGQAPDIGQHVVITNWAQELRKRMDGR